MQEIRGTQTVIIGGGINGLSLAYNLAKMKHKAIVIEKRYCGSEGSGRNAGGVRQQGRLPAEVPLVMEATRIWDTLSDDLGVDTEFRRTGNIFLATTDAELEAHHKMTERIRKQGLEVYVVDEKEARKIVPALKKGVCKGGSYSPTCGMANPYYTSLGYASKVRNLGVEIMEYTAVTDIVTKNNCIDGVITDKGYIKCDRVVIAAGSWSVELGKMVGIDIPITPCRNQMMVTEPIPPLVRPFLLTGTCYCNQTKNGNMIIGNVDPEDYCMGNSANVNEMKISARNMLKYIPQLGDVNVIRTWGGPLDLTPDDMSILGNVDEVEGLVLACGFAGHGFATGPLIGKLLAQLIVFDKTELPIEPFRFSRFKEEKPKDEEVVYAYGQSVKKLRE
ncbi:MAG: FAD-binding oxidoreductase [Sedimentibacter sp.]|uniref:NAD(P)/FAD-dependent oxidoreductase n=1 Tax=Sedimentibacter sp. TaxID=1960295 RepID=UPI00315850CA